VPYDANEPSVNVWVSNCVPIESTGSTFGGFAPSQMYGAALAYAHNTDGPINEDGGNDNMGNKGQFVIRHFKYNIYPAETSMEICERVRGLFTNSITVADIIWAKGEAGGAATGSADQFKFANDDATKCFKNSLRNFGNTRRAPNGVGTVKFIETVVASDEIPSGFCSWDGLCPNELLLAVLLPIAFIIAILVFLVFCKSLLANLCGKTKTKPVE